MGLDTLPTVFPRHGHWPHLDDAAGRWDRERLAANIVELAGNGTASIVLLDHGRLLLERHWGPEGHNQLDDVASVQKSLIAILVGMAVDRGLLAIDDPVSKHLDEGWTLLDRRREAAITIRHLLSMTSGLTPSLDFESEPGQRWSYNTMAYQVLKPVLTAVSGEPLGELTATWLTGPIGMDATVWTPRQPVVLPKDTSQPVLVGLRSQGFRQDLDGRWAHRMPDGSLVTGLCTTARDLARLGLLVSTYGQWDGDQLVPANWITQAVKPSQDHNLAYGWLFWLGGQPGISPSGQRFEDLQLGAPDDLIAARGASQQLMEVSPSLGIVIARTAMPAASPTATNDRPAEHLWTALMSARR